jgi:hypothetical protein
MEPHARIETSPQAGPETYGFNPAVTAPTYGPPAQAFGTNPLDKAKQKRTLKIILGMVIFLIVALAGLGIGLTFWAKNRQAPAGAQQPPAAGEAATGDDLIYPGAEVNFHAKGENGEKVVQLRTNDAPDVVVAWYEKKISPSDKVRLPGVGTVLTRDDTSVMISEFEEGAQILVTQK